jgi:hypothetical protein
VARALEALAPASLDLALEAAGNVAQERARLEHVWTQRLERAQYEAERAARQFRCVEPENRLVARQLEADWERSLAAQRTLEEEHRRFQREHPSGLTDLEREAIRRLAADIPSIWSAPTTTPAERKEILRQIIDRIVIDVDGTTEKVCLRIEWAGGSQSSHATRRSVRSWEQLSDFARLCDRLHTLEAEGWTARQIADQLHADGFRPPKRSERFDIASVQNLRRRLGLARSRRRAGVALREHEWMLPDLAAHVPVPIGTLHHWVSRGAVRSRRTDERRPRLIVWADPDEVERLREIRRRPPGYASRDRWLRNQPAPPDPHGGTA